MDWVNCGAVVDACGFQFGYGRVYQLQGLTAVVLLEAGGLTLHQNQRTGLFLLLLFGCLKFFP